MNAQNLTSGADFLKIDSGARSQGMGGAFTAVADDVNSLTWNPAGLALLKKPEIGYLHMIYLSDIGYNFGGVAFPVQLGGGDTLGIGAAVVNLGSPSFDSTLGLAPAVSAGDNAFSLSAAYRIQQVFSFGLTGKFILRNLAGYNANAFGGDVGMLITPTPQFSIGMGLFNLGTQVQFISEGDPLPLTGRLGLAFKVIDEPHANLILAVDNAYDLNASMYSGAAGAEFWIEKTFALRAGYTGDAYQQHWTAGTGFNLDAFELDYAYAPMGTVGDSHRISLIVRFGAEGESLAAPVGVTVVPGNGSISLKWKPAPSNSVSGYNIYVRKPDATGLVRATKHPLGASETSANLTHLLNGKNYTVGIASVSPGGRESEIVSYSAMPIAPVAAPAAAAPSPLSVPTGFKAVLNNVGMDLVWDRTFSPDVVGYNLYWADGVTGKLGRKMNKVPVVDAKVTLTKVNPTRVYPFFVTSVGKDGSESPAASLTVVYNDLKKAGEAANPALAIPTMTPIASPVVTPKASPAATSKTTSTPTATPALTATPAPAAPPAPKLTMTVQGNQAKLSWNDAGPGMLYNLYTAMDDAPLKLKTPDHLAQTSVTLSPIKPGHTYKFAVTVLDPKGLESEQAVQTYTPETPSPATP